jgi:hypothetical protein
MESRFNTFSEVFGKAHPRSPEGVVFLLPLMTFELFVRVGY